MPRADHTRVSPKVLQTSAVQSSGHSRATIPTSRARCVHRSRACEPAACGVRAVQLEPAAKRAASQRARNHPTHTSGTNAVATASLHKRVVLCATEEKAADTFPACSSGKHFPVARLANQRAHSMQPAAQSRGRGKPQTTAYAPVKCIPCSSPGFAENAGP